MRFMEIANPEDQLALWRLISDNVWSAVMAQAKQAAAQKAQAAANPKPKKFKPKKAIPKPPPAPKPKPPTPKPPPPKPKPNAINPQLTPQPNAQLPTTQQNLFQPYNGAVSRLNNASFGVKPHTFGGDNGA